MAEQFPPLARNPDLFFDRLYPVLVVLNGLQGPLIVEGQQFQGTMPPFDHLPDASVAGVVNYIRTKWDNEGLLPSAMADVDTGEVAAARQRAMTAQEVLAYRADHR